MDFILKIKNWQLFLAVILLPLVLSYGLINIIDFGTNGGFVFMSSFLVVYYILFLIWNYKIIWFFNKKHNILKPKYIKRLNWLLIVLVIYGVYLGLPFHIKSSDMLFLNIAEPFIMILGAYAIFFLAYCSGKTIKYMQLQNKIRRADIVEAIIVILVFPIGVLLYQQIVNKYRPEK